MFRFDCLGRILPKMLIKKHFFFSFSMKFLFSEFDRVIRFKHTNLFNPNEYKC